MKLSHWLIALVALIVIAGFVFSMGSGNAVPYFDSSSPVKYYYSDSCTHCIAMKPILTKLAGEGYRVNPQNVDKNPALWNDISGTPTWIAANGEKIVGQQSEEVIKAWLDSHGAKIK